MAGLALTVDIAPHRRNRPGCAGCGQVGPVYDRLAPRRFKFVPLWGLRVFVSAVRCDRRAGAVG
jgi:transposase